MYTTGTLTSTQCALHTWPMLNGMPPFWHSPIRHDIKTTCKCFLLHYGFVHSPNNCCVCNNNCFQWLGVRLSDNIRLSSLFDGRLPMHAPVEPSNSEMRIFLVSEWPGVRCKNEKKNSIKLLIQTFAKRTILNYITKPVPKRTKPYRVGREFRSI